MPPPKDSPGFRSTPSPIPSGAADSPRAPHATRRPSPHLRGCGGFPAPERPHGHGDSPSPRARRMRSSGFPLGWVLAPRAWTHHHRSPATLSREVLAPCVWTRRQSRERRVIRSWGGSQVLPLGGSSPVQPADDSLSFGESCWPPLPSRACPRSAGDDETPPTARRRRRPGAGSWEPAPRPGFRPSAFEHRRHYAWWNIGQRWVAPLRVTVFVDDLGPDPLDEV